jgi:hypothetical protein
MSHCERINYLGFRAIYLTPAELDATLLRWTTVYAELFR